MQLIFEAGGRQIPFSSGHDLMKSLGHVQTSQFLEIRDETGAIVGFGHDAVDLVKSGEALARGREVLAKAEAGAKPLQSRRAESNFSRRAKHDFSSILATLESIHRERFG